MRTAVSLFAFVSLLSLAVTGCNKSDNPSTTTAGGSGEAATPETAPLPAADKLEFFGYWIGMPWGEFLARAQKTHAFELKPPYMGENLDKSAEGHGTIEGVKVEGRFASADGKLAMFNVFHVTTEPVPMPQMVFHKALISSVGRAEGGCQGKPTDMHCEWKAGGASLQLSKTEGWAKGAPAMEHEYKVYAAIDEPVKEPTDEDLARREDETNQKKREEVIKEAVMKAEQIQLSSKGKLKPTANDCLWKLNNEDPQKAFEVAQCMVKAEVYNDLRACAEPCRPPDPSLSK
ncbi:MAG: hypothetical protein JRF63_03045 [Deltaproteobacteria bacterium]|nr:hypothetical protein [Deltaproteobacteria bacterium]